MLGIYGKTFCANQFNQYVKRVLPSQWTHHRSSKRWYLSILSTNTKLNCPYVPWVCQTLLLKLSSCTWHNCCSYVIFFCTGYYLWFFWAVPKCLGKKSTGLPVHFSCLESRHKAVFDEVFWNWCGESAGFCQFWKMKPVLLFVIHCRARTQRTFNAS